ncbi:conserved hypothetical protein [Geobacillus kaustophilus GBlys]|uniref:YhdB-like protein n=1 Tax=Geobacillus kaustophilus GBlys TaxID=1337888 RepID=U2X763_GEOKU|nr:conserved hypothetical protein [Geobacillus kaustophilus GBlys]
MIKEACRLNTVDYDKALYYTHRSEWDNLLILMVRTPDDILSKKIEKFLHAYNFEHDYSVIQERLHALLRYIDHALEVSEQKMGVEQYAQFYS